MRAFFERFTLALADQRAIFDQLQTEHAGEDQIALQTASAEIHWLSDEALGLATKLLYSCGLPLHMNLLETPYQREYARRRTGGSMLDHLPCFGLVSKRLAIGHGVWMTESDIRQCAGHGVRICHNCSSNPRLKSGIAPVNRFLAEGIPVALGIDEAGINDHRDMLQEMRLLLSAHREPGIDAPHPSCAQVFRIATTHGAETTPFAARIGSLAPGAAADLAIFDWAEITAPYLDTETLMLDVILHRAKTGSVKTVMVAGEVIYHEGCFTRLDRAEIQEAIVESLSRPLTTAEQNRPVLAEAVFPHVKAFYDRWLPENPGEPFTHYNAKS